MKSYKIGSYSFTKDEFTGNKEIGGSLDLRSLTSIPEGFNPTVGGSLYLRSLTSIPEGFNPTVGGYLDLRSLTSIPEGFNPTVGGSLDLRSLTSIPEGFNQSNVENKDVFPMYWQDGKYMMVDGVFGEIISHKRNIFKLKRIDKDEIFYCVEKDGIFSHGNNIREAKDDLIYKISERANLEEFKSLKLDSVLAFDKCIQLYRIVTGACAFGVKQFIESHDIEHKPYTVAEIIEKTKGQYGADRLIAFFN